MSLVLCWLNQTKATKKMSEECRNVEWEEMLWMRWSTGGLTTLDSSWPPQCRHSLFSSTNETVFGYFSALFASKHGPEPDGRHRASHLCLHGLVRVLLLCVQQLHRQLHLPAAPHKHHLRQRHTRRSDPGAPPTTPHPRVLVCGANSP